MRVSRRAVAAVLCAATAIVLAPTAADAAKVGERTLRKGMSGSDVRKVQRYLDRIGHETTVDGEYGRGTARSVRAFETEEDRRANGVLSRSDARLLRRRAREAKGEAMSGGQAPTEKATLTDDGLAVAPASAPPQVKAVITAGNEIAKKPYKLGGGHGRLRDSGYDCSGSMSYALRKAGLLDESMDSTGFTSFGDRGRGQWITTRANSGHSYMMVAGLRFDTSARKETGSRWTDEMRSARGYRGRHPEGL